MFAVLFVIEASVINDDGVMPNQSTIHTDSASSAANCSTGIDQFNITDKSVTLQYLPGVGQTGCCSACKNISTCAAFSVDVHGCTLKNGTEGLAPAAGFISATVTRAPPSPPPLNCCAGGYPEPKKCISCPEELCCGPASTGYMGLYPSCCGIPTSNPMCTDNYYDNYAAMCCQTKVCVVKDTPPPAGHTCCERADDVCCKKGPTGRCCPKDNPDCCTPFG